MKEIAKTKTEIVIENFGLDLESVMPWIKNQIIFDDHFKKIKIVLKTLILILKTVR
jgi:hypothetical protein